VTFFAPLLEARAPVENPSVPLTSANIMPLLGTGSANDSGVTVSADSVLGIAAVWRAVNIIAGTSASLPLKTYRLGTRERTQVDLLDHPHPSMTSYELWEWAYTSLLLWGNAYFWKERRMPGGRIQWLVPVQAAKVKVGRALDEFGVATKVFEIQTDNRTIDATEEDVLHIPGFGYDGVVGLSPIRIARQSFGVTIAAEKHAAEQLGSGNRMTGILSSDQELSNEQAEQVLTRWNRQRNAGYGSTRMVSGGFKFQPVTMPNDDAQFLESRKFQVGEISRWFGVPPHMLFEIDKSTSWGTGIEQQGIGFVTYTLRPYLVRFEQRITRELLAGDGYAEYAVDGLLRGDSAARAAYHTAMRNIGAENVDEIRAFENLEPLPDGLGQEYLRPLNMAVLGDTDGDELTLTEKVAAVTALVAAGFDPSAALVAVGLPPIDYPAIPAVPALPAVGVAPMNA
jgi:HK97 family phage portal protein